MIRSRLSDFCARSFIKNMRPLATVSYFFPTTVTINVKMFGYYSLTIEVFLSILDINNYRIIPISFQIIVFLGKIRSLE